MLLTRMSSHGRILFVEMILSAALAQLVERRLGKAEVGGSNPLGSSSNESEYFSVFRFFLFSVWSYQYIYLYESFFISLYVLTNLFFGNHFCFENNKNLNLCINLDGWEILLNIRQ